MENSEFLIAVLYMAAPGIVQALRLFSVVQTGKLFIGVIASAWRIFLTMSASPQRALVSGRLLGGHHRQPELPVMGPEPLRQYSNDLIAS